MKFSLAAFVVSTLVLLSFIALNVDSNTSPDDFTTITAPLIEIGYGWPFVCVVGSIETERHFYATGFMALWTSTNNPTIAWLGMVGNLILASVLVSCAHYAAKSVLAKLEPKLTIAILIGATLFVALVVLARLRTWDEYSDIDSGIPMRILIGDLFHYAELIVWGAILVACLTLPTVLTPRVAEKGT
ncbi:MAG: hypothetical protein R3C53_16355 [Pirellulaceae bacterium]